MTPKRQRLWFLLFGLSFLIASSLMILNAFSDNLVFFYTPSDLLSKKPEVSMPFRLGGLVEEGSVKQDGQNVHFRVTDLTHTLDVRYSGILPALFREGQGVVAEGKMEADGTFLASSLLAKHDENYMPPEVARKLKESGEWKPTQP